MAIIKGKSEGGHKRGHSNMVHYDYTEDIKRAAKKVRRQDGKKIIRDQLNERPA